MKRCFPTLGRIVPALGLALGLAGCGGGGSTHSTVLPTYTVGGTVSGLAGTLVLQNNGGNKLTLTANGTFTFPMALSGGTPYNVTVLLQPAAQTCTVANGTGTANANITNVTVTCVAGGAPARFAYTTNFLSGDVSAYTIAPTTGAFTRIGNANYTSGNNPRWAAISPIAMFLYVTNNASNTIAGFAINASTGALTTVSGSPFATGAGPEGIAIDPSGTYLYAAGTGSVSAYTISGSGALAPVAGSPFGLPAGSMPRGIVVHPSGKFVYAADSTNNAVVALSVGATGALTLIGTVPAGTTPQGLAIDPKGTFLYAANLASNDVYIYSINPTTGALTNALTTGGTPVGSSAEGIAISPQGTFLYVVCQGTTVNSNYVAVLAVGANGALTPIAGSPFALPATSSPRGIAIDPTGTLAFITLQGSSYVYTFPLNTTTGALSAATSFISTGTSPTSVVIR